MLRGRCMPLRRPLLHRDLVAHRRDAQPGERQLLRQRVLQVPERAQDLARRWKAQVAQFTQGDQAIAAKAKAVWSEAMANPDAAPKLPLNPEIFAFIEKAWEAAATPHP